MSKTVPILLIDDDLDDADIFKSILGELQVQNELVWFHSTLDAFDFLKKMDGQPFLIVSDVNLPKQTGIEFKKRVDQDPLLKTKCIPFVFLSTSVDKYVVTQAYEELTIQGFFKKPSSYAATKVLLREMIEYWRHCEHPSNC